MDPFNCFKHSEIWGLDTQVYLPERLGKSTVVIKKVLID